MFDQHTVLGVEVIHITAGVPFEGLYHAEEFGVMTDLQSFFLKDLAFPRGDIEEDPLQAIHQVGEVKLFLRYLSELHRFGPGYEGGWACQAIVS